MGRLSTWNDEQRNQLKDLWEKEKVENKFTTADQFNKFAAETMGKTVGSIKTMRSDLGLVRSKKANKKKRSYTKRTPKTSRIMPRIDSEAIHCNIPVSILPEVMSKGFVLTADKGQMALRAE